MNFNLNKYHKNPTSPETILKNIQISSTETNVLPDTPNVNLTENYKRSRVFSKGCFSSWNPTKFAARIQISFTGSRFA